jgi:hypothetical protein
LNISEEFNDGIFGLSKAVPFEVILFSLIISLMSEIY